MKILKLLSIMMVASVGTVWAQDAAQTSGTLCCPPGTMCCPMMMGRGEKMMEWHQKALEKFKAQNAELDRLIEAMNAAQGPKKIDAMAAVINKAMEQRKTWQADMEARQQKMMEWMKTHPMKSGTGALPSPEAH